MKFLIGTTEICGHLVDFAEGFRSIGHEASTLVSQTHKWLPRTYDYQFNEGDLNADSLLHLGFLMGDCDVFICVWTKRSILPNQLDIPFLKKMGKTVVMVCVGSDVRDYDSYKQYYRNGCSAINTVPFPSDPIEVALGSTRFVEEHADVILSQPNQSIYGVRAFHHFYVPLELSKYGANIPAREIPKILHIPSRKAIKGTEYFTKALQTLEAEGVQFEFKFLEDLAHESVLAELQDADILLDELYFPLHGMLSAEAMASGCVVVNGDNESYEPIPPNRPICKVTLEDLVPKLRELIVSKEKRHQLARHGLEYVRVHHDRAVVCQRVIDAVLGKLPPDHQPMFYLRDYQLEHGRNIPNELLLKTSNILRQHAPPPEISIQSLIERGLAA